MLGIDQRAARYAWTAAVVVLALCLVYLLRRTLFIFILALLFAYLLSPLVKLLDRALPGRTRAPALALAYIIFVGGVVLLGVQIGSRVAEQATIFAKRFPAMIANWENPAPEATPAINSLKAQIVEKDSSGNWRAFQQPARLAAGGGLEIRYRGGRSALRGDHSRSWLSFS